MDSGVSRTQVQTHLCILDPAVLSLHQNFLKIERILVSLPEVCSKDGVKQGIQTTRCMVSTQLLLLLFLKSNWKLPSKVFEHANE